MTRSIALNKSKYGVALVGLVASNIACAGVAVGISVGAVVGTPVGTAIAQATGLPIEAVGGGAVFAIAAIALVVGIRIVRRKQGR
jgi:predicted MFS family arabinose efflux permease